MYAHLILETLDLSWLILLQQWCHGQLLSSIETYRDRLCLANYCGRDDISRWLNYAKIKISAKRHHRAYMFYSLEIYAARKCLLWDEFSCELWAVYVVTGYLHYIPDLPLGLDTQFYLTNGQYLAGEELQNCVCTLLCPSQLILFHSNTGLGITPATATTLPVLWKSILNLFLK